VRAFHPVAFVSRAAGVGGTVLVAANAVAYRRRWRSPCLFCGRTRTAVRPAQPPRWAWLGVYAAVAGCLLRLLAQLAVGFGSSLLHAGGSVMAFEAGFVLAGTVLPLALVHPWVGPCPGGSRYFRVGRCLVGCCLGRRSASPAG
jgi:hypothetical protein